jgi:hypothetical protein
LVLFTFCNILGFAKSVSDTQNGIYNSVFSSPEGGSNIRSLMVSFSTFVAQYPPSPVPLPTLLPLLLAELVRFAALPRHK